MLLNMLQRLKFIPIDILFSNKVTQHAYHLFSIAIAAQNLMNRQNGYTTVDDEVSHIKLPF